ncbi:TetR/AcrR family transcriptional regulator [Phyllobacterium sp. 628]|uniref:TetR/AcrR family transcriptional regulator n=1 Tax=Phyllobacterium sp. 628 TaxID=2718938 RepID=UPI0016623DE4|nr:TetR/AcrR family transcriptional regulator [Phyllobacterium sp. 628]QND52307.1 TetR/AcrR family transcriptional regulator [Phyllobacterium sp. 628]
MRYSKGHKAETRQRLIDVASKRFRKDGIEATGLAGVMAEAGLTHGGFYAHFSSKEDLVQESLTAALASTSSYLAYKIGAARKRGENTLETIVRTYLQPAHLGHPELGCAVPPLIAEIGRHSLETRARLTEIIEGITGLIAAELPGNLSENTARDRAYAIFGGMIGTLQLARMVPDQETSNRILESGRQAALALANQPAV